MNPETPRSKVEDLLTDTKIYNLLELQQFLAKEIGAEGQLESDVTRSFLPLTDGLGLEDSPTPSPEKKTQAPIKQDFFSPREGARNMGDLGYLSLAPESETSAIELELEREKPAESLKSIGSFASVMGEVPDRDTEYEKPVELSTEIPPSIPLPGVVRRFLAATMDQFFVLSLWVLALAITSNFLAGQSEGFSIERLLTSFSNSHFRNFALLEFAAIWFSYLAITVGILEMTFGMWVWGMKIAYGEGMQISKRITRVLFDCLFAPFVLPSALLVFQSKGKNLLDFLSASHLYRTGS